MRRARSIQTWEPEDASFWAAAGRRYMSVESIAKALADPEPVEVADPSALPVAA